MNSRGTILLHTFESLLLVRTTHYKHSLTHIHPPTGNVFVYQGYFDRKKLKETFSAWTSHATISLEAIAFYFFILYFLHVQVHTSYIQPVMLRVFLHLQFFPSSMTFLSKWVDRRCCGTKRPKQNEWKRRKTKYFYVTMHSFGYWETNNNKSKTNNTETHNCL